jgi:hypothetical protein
MEPQYTYSFTMLSCMTNGVFFFRKVTEATEMSTDIMKLSYSIAVSLVTYVVIQIFVEKCCFL